MLDVNEYLHSYNARKDVNVLVLRIKTFLTNIYLLLCISLNSNSTHVLVAIVTSDQIKNY